MKIENNQVGDLHAKIMIKIIENADRITNNTKNSPPTIEDALNTIINNTDTDENTKNVIQSVLSHLPNIKNFKNNVDGKIKNKLTEIENKLAKIESVDEMIKYLEMIRKDFPNNQDIALGIGFAIDILKAGQNTIYNPNFLNKKKNGLGSKIKEYIKVDSLGAVGGAASVGTIGSAVAEPSNIPLTFAVGSLVGAIDTSGTKLVLDLWNIAKKR